MNQKLLSLKYFSVNLNIQGRANSFQDNIKIFKHNYRMKELLEKIDALYASFKEDACLQDEKGNKAAGTRARKNSLEIEKLMKQFRKESLEASKK